jgi:large subunit ribosomal protein L23
MNQERQNRQPPASGSGHRLNQERLLKVLLSPVISEKSTRVGEKANQAVFRVMHDATKAEIRAAVQLLFKVEVEAVQVLNLQGKAKRFGRFQGRRRDTRKAYVCLKPGSEINFAEIA